MTVDLHKPFAPGSLRALGSYPFGLAAHELPIAGVSRAALVLAMRGRAYRISRISPRNAFVVYSRLVPYVYVRPSYGGYRAIARLRFHGVSPTHHVDHVLARSLAKRLGYEYVLLALVPGRANTLHGGYEKHLARTNSVPPICVADQRIVDKVLGRYPESRRDRGFLRRGYAAGSGSDLGLTVQQRGIWNCALGFDRYPPPNFLGRLRPLRVP